MLGQLGALDVTSMCIGQFDMPLNCYPMSFGDISLREHLYWAFLYPWEHSIYEHLSLCPSGTSPLGNTPTVPLGTSPSRNILTTHPYIPWEHSFPTPFGDIPI